MTRRRAQLVAAAIAAACFLTALPNRFTLDDEAIVERNPAAHRVGAAVSAMGRPYWPPEHGAGQWRPLVILSFAADWALSGGSAAWLHATNVIWHAAAAVLLVPVLAAYVPVGAALAGAAVFAAHPVHVEAVANLVGRAESMVAVFLLAALLLAREARKRRASGLGAGAAEGLVVLAVAGALLSKEHAAVAIGVLALDDSATRKTVGPRLRLRVYSAVAIVTAVWLAVRQGVDQGQSFAAVAPTFLQLDAWGRVWTMLPAVLVVVRLLVWPQDLSPDYHPAVIERLQGPTPAGWLGLLMLIALAALAVALWRRSRGVSVGLLLTGGAWLPTSNILFPTGIVVAERALYLPSVGLALIAASLSVSAAGRFGQRAVILVISLAVTTMAIHSARAAPRWRSNRDLVIHALQSHPESYRVHQAAARVYRRIGRPERALREYALGAELYPLDHYHLAEAGGYAIEAGEVRLGMAYLRQAEALDSANTLTQQLLATGLLTMDSAQAALGHARRSLTAGPTRAQAARVLAASWVALAEPESALAIWPAFGARGGSGFERWIMQASTHAALGQADAATAALDSALLRAPADSTAALQIKEVRRLIRSLR